LKEIKITLNTSELVEKLKRLTYHMEEAEKAANEINSTEIKDLISFQSNNQ
jgi:hypothetical protein